MTNRISRRAIACALYATTAYCGMTAQPAAAQAYSAGVAQKFRAVDANGVDVTWGDFLMNFVEGSIGSGEAKLDLVREAPYRPGAYDGNNNNLHWDRIWLSYTAFPVSTTGTHINVNLGSRFESFTGAGTLPSGSMLSGGGSNFTYTTADGTVIDFADPTGSTASSSNYCNGSQGQCILLPVSITSPDGRTVNISWDVNTYYLTSGGGGGGHDLCGPDDPNCVDGGTTTVSYDTRINNVSNSFGYRIAFTYASNVGGSGAPSAEAWHQRTSASLFNDNVSTTTAQSSVSYSYPTSGVTQVTDIGGRVWRFTGTNDRVTGIRRPGASSDTTSVAYDINAKVSSVTREGVTTGYSRSVSGSTATMTITDPLSYSKVITSDLNVGRPTSIVDELGRTTSYTYDSNGNLSRVTQPEGNYANYTYDGRGNVTQVRQVAKSGSGLSDIVTSASYDSTCSNPVTCNEPNSTTDAKGNVTDYTYDSTHGGVLTVTAPAPTTGATRPQARFSYTLTSGEYRLTGVSACATGSAPSCVGTADEVKTSAAYDANGNVTSTSSGAGDGSLTATSAMTYDAVGNLLTVDGPLSGSADTTRYRYDTARDLIGVTSPDPDGAGPLKMRAIRNSYTNALLTKREIGTVNSQSDSDWAAFSSAQAVDVSYDANARPTQQKLSSGGTNYALTQFSYDTLGRSDCSAVRMNPAVYGSLPSSACTLGTAGSFGNDRISQIVYDAASEPTQLKVAVGTSDAATERTMVYSSNGLVQTLTDGENNKTTYVYDGFDRPYLIQYPSATKGAGTSNASDYEQFGIDDNGNIGLFRNRAGQTFTFSFDNLNRMTFKDRPGTEPDVTYGYDLLGRMTSAVQYGTSLTFTYDALSRQTSEAGQTATVYQQFDLAGRRTQLSASNGYLLNFARLVTGEMTAIIDRNNNIYAALAYDDLGRRTAVSYLDGSTASWSYDGVSRLASLTHDFPGTTYDLTKTFAYNPASQIISETRSNDAYAYTAMGNGSLTTTTNGLNQPTNIGGGIPTHDANGNLTYDNVTGKSYVYTSENQLAGSNGIGLYYDPLDRLMSITPSSGTRKFLYAPGDSGLPEAITEYDGGGGIVAQHMFGPGPDEPLVWWDVPASTLRMLHADERGSVIAASNGSGVVPINTYDEYGKPGASNLGRFQYTGQMWLPEASAYNYKARTYSPALGRFLQTDPIGYEDSPNPYAYVLNDPVNLSDPLGLTVKCVTVGATASAPAHTSCGDDGGGGGGPPPSPPGALSLLAGHSGGDSSGNTGDDNSPGMAPGNQDPTIAPNPQPQKEIVVTGTRRRTVQLASNGPWGWFEIVKAILELKGDTCESCNSPTLKFSNSKTPQKWANQMKQRGWTFPLIEGAIQHGKSFPASNNLYPSHGATRYVSPVNGQSVVVDNVSGEIIHIGGPGFGY